MTLLERRGWTSAQNGHEAHLFVIYLSKRTASRCPCHDGAAAAAGGRRRLLPPPLPPVAADVRRGQLRAAGRWRLGGAAGRPCGDWGGGKRTRFQQIKGKKRIKAPDAWLTGSAKALREALRRCLSSMCVLNREGLKIEREPHAFSEI